MPPRLEILEPGSRVERFIAKPRALHSFMGMTQDLFGKQYPSGRKGLELAVFDVEEHRRSIFPQLDPASIAKMLRNRDPFIAQTQKEAVTSLNDGQYFAVFEASNRMHLFAQASMLLVADEGVTFFSSLIIQKKITRTIFDEFVDKDPYLQMYKDELRPYILNPTSGLPRGQEYQMLRSVAHTVAFNGTVGENVRTLVDPYAFFFTRKVMGLD